MKLSEYLKKKNETQASFAARLDPKVSPSLISQWINGITEITAEKARDIERATGGLVTRHDLRPDIFDKAA